MALILEPDCREIARYLGYRRVKPDAEVQQEIEYCVSKLQQEVTPRFAYEKYPLIITEDVHADTASGSAKRNSEEGGPIIPVIRAAGLEIRSRNLARNLRGCTELYFMAATLGPAPDRLVQRASITAMSRALIYQAAAAAMIETWCDEVCRRISADAGKDGLYCRPRFSPGYGDAPLDLQKDFERILHMSKEIGVGLTDTLLMTPSKSVTAFIGASPVRQPCHERGCEVCNMRDTCSYSRASGT